MRTRTSKLSFDKAELGGRQDLAIGQSGIQMGQYRSPSKESFAKMMGFGLFGNISHDGNAFDETITASSIMPKAEDFIDVPFRFISATIVGGHSWKATDFSNTDVLRGSVSKLDGKPIYPNHEPELYNWVGIVADPYWDEGGLQAGSSVPGGINGIMRLDVKTNAKIARGVLLKIIFSNSVTVAFDWVPSHHFESEQEFDNRVGTISELDGKMITRQVTKIHDYFETSLVWLGADPFAKLLDENGELVNIDASSISFSKAAPEEQAKYTSEKKYVLDFGIDKNILSLSKERLSKGNGESRIKPKDTKNMKTFLAAFIAAFGTQLKFKNALPKDGEDLSPELELELTTAISSLALKDDTPPAELTKLQTFISSLQQLNEKGEVVPFDIAKDTGTFRLIAEAEATRVYGQVSSLTKDATIGQRYIAAKKAECIRQYNLTVKGQSDQAVLDLINNATPEALDGLVKTYAKNLTDEFKPFCKSCKSSEHVEMRSSIPEEGNTEDVSLSGSLTGEELREKYSGSKMRLGGK